MPRPRHTQPSRSRVGKNPPARLSPEAESWIKRTLARMSLEEKLGQLVMLSFQGEFTSAESAEYRELQRSIEHNHVGSFMLGTRLGRFGIEIGKPYATAALINRLQKTARIPLLIAADFERGTAMRLENGTSFPHAMAVAATGRPEDAYTVGRITAAEARAVGVQWIFAPVVDVNSNPDNPIINMRSFGEDPRGVSAFVESYVRGVEENGALSTAKHFPGHGDTVVDSHLDLPVVSSDRAHLETIELPPFRAAFAAGASTLMTGHLAVPALDADGMPATLSPKMIDDLLRRGMGFDGLVVSDSLDMGGIARHYAPAEAAVQTLLAGTDLLLQPPVVDAALAALKEAVESGRLSLDRIDQSVTRVLRAKARVGLHGDRFVDLDSLPRSLARIEFSRAADNISGRGVTLLRHTQRILPLDAARPLKLLLLSIAGDPDIQPGRFLESEARRHADSLEALRFDTRFAPIGGFDFSKLAGPYDAVILAVFVRVADRKGSVALPDDQAAAVHRVLASGKPVIVACFGSPYVIKHFPEAKTWVGVFSNADVAQRAAARAIFGQTPVSGRIPVNVPGAVCIGAGMDLPANPMKLLPASVDISAKLSPACALLDKGIAARAYPGGVLAVGRHGRLSVHAFGRKTYAPSKEASAKVNASTIYDAASLTKPVVAATLCAMLSEAGQLEIAAPVSRYLPGWVCGTDRERRERVTVAHLLAHASGLPAHKDYFAKLRSREEIVASAMAEPLTYEPGALSIYSDIGFILLGTIIERLTGRRLDELAQERIFAPLGMTSTFFNPPKSLRSRIAPTERVSGSRKRSIHSEVHGEVHDENASAMGGIAGHAGMFSTGPDLVIFCQMLLNGGIYAHERLLRRQTVAEFTSATPLAKNTRTLGWNVPTDASSSGRYFSKQSFGHTGFTGTSIWIDPQKDLFVVLLTNANRTLPNPQDDEIRRVQPAVHNVIVECLGLAPSSS